MTEVNIWEEAQEDKYDLKGELPLIVTIELFCKWLFGRGKDRHFGKLSPISAKLKSSGIMQDAIEDAIEKFETHQPYERGSVMFTNKEPDLWLSIRRAAYSLAIVKEKKVRKNGQKLTRYQVRVRLWDTYNFNIGNEKGDGFGSFLNNIGYWLERIHIGKDYFWEVCYTHKTRWL